MKKIFAVFLIAALAPLYSPVLVNAATCPSPLPKCTTSSSTTLAYLKGAFACLATTVKSSGEDKVELHLVTFNGEGSFTAKSASNDNSSSGDTYSDFSASIGTYCINTDQTGYLVPSDSCPNAIILDNSKSQIRAIDSSENRAGSFDCTKQ